MDKYIAFNVYRKNEQGGHQPANANGDPQEVYLAKDVHELLERCRDNLYHPHEPEMIRKLEAEIDSLLMGS
jgi:hypothetical protein